MLTLSKEIPGGNFRFISQDGNRIVLEEEQRDSKNPWFYWKFKAVFTEPGEYCFHFTQPNKVGPRSAAVSCDFGKTWSWLSQVPYPDSQNFTFLCDVPGEYWFCQCIPYMQTDFESFVSEYKDNPLLSISAAGKTAHGRDVELVTIREGNPQKCIFLTARHHAQESMASYALEGILREVLSDSDFARKFRKEYVLYAVPFVDKDGVENGDQGKGRIPRDHARDYQGKSFYPEITAIREFLKTIKPVFALDMHCPWIRFGSNEYSYMTQHADAAAAIEVERFAGILETEAPDCAPFFKRDILRWGVEWNVRGNALTSVLPGYGVGGFIQNEMKDCKCSVFSIEIPFANFREKTILQKEIRLFGKSMIHSVSKYIDALAEEEKKNSEMRQAVLCFSKVLSPASNENEHRKIKLDCSDYKVGFLDDICNQQTNEEKLKY